MHGDLQLNQYGESYIRAHTHAYIHNLLSGYGKSYYAARASFELHLYGPACKVVRAYVSIHIYMLNGCKCKNMQECMYVCMYVCMCVCM